MLINLCPTPGVGNGSINEDDDLKQLNFWLLNFKYSIFDYFIILDYYQVEILIP